MTTAIISDIHGNLEALDAVLAELDRRHPDRVVCLGDIVGYGASPNECLDRVRKRCGTVLLGNHDAAASGGPEAARFNIYARVAAEWTMKTLTRDNREYLQRLPLTAQENSCTRRPRVRATGSTCSTGSMRSRNSTTSPR
jgi:predicted phosphodiesterase